jgi:Ca2+-binding EF-hand superfamily protein
VHDQGRSRLEVAAAAFNSAAHNERRKTTALRISYHAVVESMMSGLADYGTLRIAALAVAIALIGTASAQAQMKGNFEDADANHDGRVTFQEFEAYATSRLSAANGPMAKMFKLLNPQQQADRLQTRFDKLDNGHKGYLDRNDWTRS